MLSRKGFTLIELMVVILIVAILAAIAIPIMRGRIDDAKWSEGKAMMGTIATAIRAYCASENPPVTGPAVNFDIANLNFLDLGFDAKGVDLDGTYFKNINFSWTGTYQKDTHALLFEVKATNPATIGSPTVVLLDQAGKWTETP